MVLVTGEDAASLLCVLVSEVDEEQRRELMLRGVPEHCCQSHLWDKSVRDNVTDHRIPEQVMPSFLAATRKEEAP